MDAFGRDAAFELLSPLPTRAPHPPARPAGVRALGTDGQCAIGRNCTAAPRMSGHVVRLLEAFVLQVLTGLEKIASKQRLTGYCSYVGERAG